jgi:hypothetical protein
MARLEGTCVYCGAFGTIHMDHVPPKNLFEAQAQSQLLTVPACRSCNNSASKDDEYFLVVMALRSDATLRPEHPNLWQKALRLLRRDRAAGFRKRVVADVKFVQPVTPTGLVLPRALSIPVEPFRVIGTVVRIVKGLYYHETERRFPETHQVIPYDMLAYQQARFERLRDAALIFELAGELQKTPLKRVGRVFAYQWDSDPKQPANTRWLLNFFEGIRFVGLTLPTGANLLEDRHD